MVGSTSKNWTKENTPTSTGSVSTTATTSTQGAKTYYIAYLILQFKNSYSDLIICLLNGRINLQKLDKREDTNFHRKCFNNSNY